jgi:hypothetical protein
LWNNQRSDAHACCRIDDGPAVASLVTPARLRRGACGSRREACEAAGTHRRAGRRSRAPAHQFYAGLGYALVKTQYSFVKPLAPSGAEMAGRLVPRVDDGEAGTR